MRAGLWQVPWPGVVDMTKASPAAFSEAVAVAGWPEFGNL